MGVRLVREGLSSLRIPRGCVQKVPTKTSHVTQSRPTAVKGEREGGVNVPSGAGPLHGRSRDPVPNPRRDSFVSYPESGPVSPTSSGP